MNKRIEYLRGKVAEKADLYGDLWVWLILFALCYISAIEVYSASSRDSYVNKAFWEPGVQHGIYLTIGLVGAWITSLFNCNILKVFCIGGLLISIGMLIHLAFGGGVTLNGGTRWISICGFTIQPSEIAKPCLVGFAATFLATFRNSETGEVRKFAFITVCAITLGVFVLIFKENISTAGLLLIVIFMICGYARPPRRWMVSILYTLGILGVSFFSFLIMTPEDTLDKIVDATGFERLETARNRLTGGLEIPEDPKDFDYSGYNVQETHARIAISSGGFIGHGPGSSTQCDYLPMAFSDFIYAIIIEEGGWFAGTVVLLLYLFLLYRCFRIAKRCKQRFPAYLVMGLSLMLVFQALLNMSVAVGIFPVTGQPLPLVSKGGTSTLLTCLYFGMILSVSHTAKQVPEEDFLKE